MSKDVDLLLLNKQHKVSLSDCKRIFIQRDYE